MGRLTPIDAIAARGLDVPLVTRVERPCGVYLLISAGQVVYIGATSNLESRLTDHFNGMKHSNPLATPRPPKVFDRVIWLALPRGELAAYEGALIRSLRPPLNKRAPAPRGRDLEILEHFGLPPHDEKAVHAEMLRVSYSPRARAERRARRARS